MTNRERIRELNGRIDDLEEMIEGLVLMIAAQEAEKITKKKPTFEERIEEKRKEIFDK